MTSATTKYFAGNLKKKKATFKIFGRFGQRSKVKKVARDGGVGEKAVWCGPAVLPPRGQCKQYLGRLRSRFKSQSRMAAILTIL